MNKEEIFNECTKSRGGLSRNQKPFEKHLKFYWNLLLSKKYANDKSLLKSFPNIIVDFVESPNVNAFATKYKDHYVIGINEGALIIILDLFCRMLSHPKVFPTIGNSEKENAERAFINGYHTNIKDLVEKGLGGEFKPILPIDNYRGDYAFFLCELALNFLFEHELSHILFGHLDYLMSEMGYKDISEFSSPIRSNEKNIDLLTLEMDADCTAINRVINYIFYIENDSIKISSVKKQKFYNDTYESLSFTYFSIYNAIKIFGDGDYKNITLGKSSHPNPRVRQLMLLATLEVFLKKVHSSIDFEKLYKDFLSPKLITSEKCYEYLTGKKVNKEVFEHKYYSQNPLAKTLEENWKNNIRERLKPHTFKPLAE